MAGPPPSSWYVAGSGMAAVSSFLKRKGGAAVSSTGLEEWAVHCTRHSWGGGREDCRQDPGEASVVAEA